MAEKDKDLFLDMLENPNLTLEDMVSVGHSAESTRFLDKSMYENSQRVRNKFSDAEGNFKQDEFDKWYSMAAKAYLDITSKDSNLSLLNVTAFNESDITVSPDKRTLNTKPIVSFSPNPDRLSTSIFRVGKTSERERTQSELALAEKVLLNPVEAAKDPSKAKWGDSPNDSWWGNFFDTLVLAQWDEDGEHIDPVTKRKVSHKAGEYKLNDNGTYYYEALDGRDIYGKQVLNKFNTITTDGSFWNQYDFFDSDDIKEKSFVGSVAKNLALVGSMFIPYVGWGVAGASIATQMVGLTGTLGKMLTGSDSPTFSAMEGWSKSLSRQGAKSEYALQNMLCWENFIDLIGDTTAQLRELRAIFKFAPAIFGKGKYGIQSEHLGMNAKALKETEMAALKAGQNLDKSKLYAAAARKGGDSIESIVGRAEATNNSVISNIADKAVLDYLKDYNELGESIARAYMVGITVGDTYGEAKEAGATDAEATLLTIGYAAAENALLKSELGRWIFPELKGEKARMTQIAKKAVEKPAALTAEGMENTLRSAGVAGTKAELLGKRIAEMPQDIREASKILGKLDDDSRLAWMKKWFNAGKEVFDVLKTILGNTAGAVFSNALAEGVEEVSEELLKDFSTSCFNIVKAAQGDKETRMNGFLGTWDWNEALKRYGMSFFGGVIGGGINSAAADYKQFKDIANMSSESAIQLLVWMDRNNEMDTFWDTVSKLPLGDKYHSTKLNADGTYELGDENNNQDLEVKRALRNQINTIHNILSVNGANVDDEGLIGVIMNSLPAAQRKDVLGDFRTNALATSVTAGRYLKEYNNLCKAIVLESLKLKELSSQTTDSGKPEPDLEAAIAESLESLKILQDAKDKLLNGERSAEFYRDALFETTYGVSESFITPTEVLFMEERSGKPYALIPKEEKEILRRKYIDWSKTERSEQIHRLSNIFWEAAKRTSLALQSSAETYQKIKEGLLENFQKVTQISANKLSDIMDILYDGTSENPLDDIQDIISGMAMDQVSGGASPLGLVETSNGLVPDASKATISDMQNLLGNLDSAFTTKWKNISEDATLTDEQKVPMIAEAFLETVHKELDKTAKLILEVGYVHPEVKRNLVPTLQQTSEYCESLIDKFSDGASTISDQDLADKYGSVIESLETISESLKELADQIKELNYTPITENLKNFAIGLGTDETVLSLVESAISREALHLDAIDNILISETDSQQYDEAEKLLKLYRASIIASRTDNADVDGVFGYNKTLNELCHNTDGWELLAEIDADTAQLALQDVNMALERLESIRGISELNLGNKLNVQNYTSANKNYILYNKTQALITSLLNEDDDDAKAVRAKWNKDGALDELQLALDSLTFHKELSGVTEKGKMPPLKNRTLSLNSEQKEQIERELHIMDDAIYNFFLKNKDKLANTEEAKKDLAQFIKAAKVDLYDKNEGILTQSSENIDDGSFLWWLASKAALKGSDFYKNYRKIISEDVAPIPTQELGVYAAVAAIANGDVFSSFGRAMKQYLRDDWESKSDVEFDANGKPKLNQDSEKWKILQEKGLYDYLPLTNADIKDINYSDLVPSFTNILFIEGIPGSGKSTGVFKTIVKMLDSLKIDDAHKILDRPIVVAHSNQENAEKLTESLKFRNPENVKAFGKEELLRWMSAEYVNRENPDSGVYEYLLNEDCVRTPEGDLMSTWKVRQLPPEAVPAVIFIDEWSRYTQPEVDLINRFASEYGTQVIAGGDMDQLSPKAYLLLSSTSKIEDADTLEMSIARNITPRVTKLGVSMRTGNGLKNLNLTALQSWKRNKTTDPVKLLYVETDTDLYGDKVINLEAQQLDLTDALLADIQKDLDKLIANLNSEKLEKIGYIYHDPESKLFKLLSSAKYKDKIDFKSEKAAQGLEAKYYIVENDRNEKQTDDEYLRSLYTGISRAELASIVIAPLNPIGKLTLRQPKQLENKLIPDNFTADGIARFSRQRKALLDAIYGEEEDSDLGTIIPREQIVVPILRTVSGPGGTLSNTQNNGLNPNPPAPSNPPTNPPQPPVSPINQPKPTPPATPGAAFQTGDVIGNGANFGTILDTIVTTGTHGEPLYFYKVDLGGGYVEVMPEERLINNAFLVQGQNPLPEPPTTPSSTPPPTSGPSATETQKVEGGEESSTEEEEPLEPTMMEVTPENISLVVRNILNSSPRVGKGLEFHPYYLANSIGVKLEDLTDVLQFLQDANIISNDGGMYEVSNENIPALLALLDPALALEAALESEEPLPEPESLPEPEPETPPTPLYKLGDIFKAGVRNEDFTIKSVEWDDNAKEFKYTLMKGTLEFKRLESYLNTLKEKGKYTPREDWEAPDGTTRAPELAAATFGSAHLQKAIELDEEHSEKPIIELAGVSANDIDLKILGYTWNTNYTGVRYDQDSGKPILPLKGEPGSRRIDWGNGLVKLDTDGTLFLDEKSLRRAIGRLRKSIMFDDNSRIEEVIKEVVPTLKDLNLKLLWAFISKAKEHRTGDGGRYYYDDSLKLDNMEDVEHAEIPRKMLSLLVLDQSGKCVLEMPMLTLSSPFTALYLLGKKDPSNKVFLAYALASAQTKISDLQILQQVIEAINTLPETKNDSGEISYGYKRLQDLCKLWQFTSDGIRRIPNMNKTPDNPRGETFNLRRHVLNLGPRYIKNRITEHTVHGKNSPYDYTMVWHDLVNEGTRDDVNYSDIMISTSDEDRNGNRIVAAGHPFILRSDSDEFVTNEDMMNRYLALQNDPKLEKIVKLEILTPPEVSVSRYLAVERPKRENCHYGDEFSAYRILSVIRKTDPKLWGELDPATRAKLSPVMDLLDALLKDLEQATDENHLEYMSRVYRELKLVMVDNNSVHEFSNALFMLTNDYNGNEFNTSVPVPAVVQRILELCDQINPETGRKFMTGILYNPVCVPADLAPRVGGYGVLIQTGANRFTNPDNLSFRIYSRYDTPAFDLTSALDSAISSWALQAVQGADERYPNIWKFIEYKDPKHPELGTISDYMSVFYNAEGRAQNPKKKSPGLDLKDKHKKLLAKLGLQDYNKLDTINDEKKFLEAIRDKFIETPGNVALVVDGNKLIYSQLTNEGISGTFTFDDAPDKFDYTSATLLKFESNNAGDNSYTLTLQDRNGNIKEVNVEMVSGNSELIFDLGMPQKVETPTIATPLFDFTPSLQAVDQAISSTRAKSVKEKLLKYKSIIEEGLKAGKSRVEISQEILKEAKIPVLQKQIQKILGEEFFKADEDITQVVELEEENLVCAITVHKKFLK